MIYRFDHRLGRGRDGHWVTIGVATGHGIGAVAEAFAELGEMSGSELPTGEYRFQPAGLDPTQWRYFQYEAGGITTLPIA